MLRINDPQKHKILYTWELYDVVLLISNVYKTFCFCDRIINLKQSELSSQYNSLQII